MDTNETLERAETAVKAANSLATSLQQALVHLQQGNLKEASEALKSAGDDNLKIEDELWYLLERNKTPF